MLLEAGETALFCSYELVQAHEPESEMFGFPRLRVLIAEHGEDRWLRVFLLEELYSFQSSGRYPHRRRHRHGNEQTTGMRKRVGSSGEARDAGTGIARRGFSFREQSRLTLSKQQFCVRRGARQHRHGP